MNDKVSTPWKNEEEFYDMHAHKFFSTGKFYHAWVLGKSDQEFAKYIINKLQLKSTDKIIDLGCGSGFLVSEISKVCKAIGISTSKECVKHSKLNFPNCKFEIGDMQTFESDKVTHFLSLESIGYADIDKTFSNVYSQLTDGGIFYIKDISIVSNPNTKEAENIRYWENYWHYIGRSIPFMINKAYEHGFKLVSVNDLNEDESRDLAPFQITLQENNLEQKYPHPEVWVHVGSEFIFKKEKRKNFNPKMLKGSLI